MSKLVCMIGCPGSGKTTLAHQMAKDALAKDQTVVLVSADDFLIKDGEYKFDPTMLRENHTLCRGKCMGALEANADLVIVHNTSLSKWEREPYIKIASDYGADYEEIVVGEFTDEAIALYASRCIHGVSAEKIRKMAQRFEK